VFAKESVVLKVFVIGGAGFIGSHLVDVLVARDDVTAVTVFDNFSVGKEAFLASALPSGKVRIVRGDLLDRPLLAASIAGHDVVYHLAANPEARYGLENTAFDLEQGTIATYNVLESMRTGGVPRIVFSSSGTVYGEASGACAEMDLGNLPISLYGASKLACEALISAFAECFGLEARIRSAESTLVVHIGNRALLERFGIAAGHRGGQRIQLAA
jgi:UDP-glucose 4-epimerase